MQPPPARNGNRTLLIVLGALFLVATCCCGGIGLFAYKGYQSGTEADREAKAFATEAVTAIGKAWSTEEFRRYGAPALQRVVDGEKSTLYVAAWRKKLGPLKTLDEFTTKGIYFGTQNGMPPATRVRLTAPATFQKGEGTLVLGVAKANGKWGIENIDIESAALLK